MLLSCPNCGTSYEVDKSSLGSTGRSVRCLRCRHIWFASNATAFAAIASAHRKDLTVYAGQTSVDRVPPSASLTVVEPAPPAPAELSFVDAPMDIETAPLDAGAEAASWEVDPESAVSLDGSADNLAATADAPALAPDYGEAALSVEAGSARSAEASDIETIAARRSVRAAMRQRTRQLQGLTTAVLLLVAINTGLIAWRADVVRWLPQTASLYAAIGMPVNLRGLDFINVKTEAQSQDGVPVLVVTGEIVSTSRHAVAVPRLRLAIRNDHGQEIYAWTALPSQNVLPPGGVLPFRSRLASPPSEGRQVLVRFFNRRDLVAGLP